MLISASCFQWLRAGIATIEVNDLDESAVQSIKRNIVHNEYVSHMCADKG